MRRTRHAHSVAAETFHCESRVKFVQKDLYRSPIAISAQQNPFILAR